ncbi:MAG TPA: PAS domain S-box protein [Verrucomicrobiae bacterium]|jgi:PAS domain S-box-containing protein
MKEMWNLWKPRPGAKNEFRFLRYSIAVILPVLGVILVYTRPVLMNSPFFVFLAGIVLSAAFGGLAPGFVSTALSVYFVRLLFIQPYFSLYHKGNVQDAERLCWFALIGLLLTSIIASLRRDRNFLRDSEERYRVLAETASDAIIVIDEQETIRFVNPVAERLFGANAQNLLGKHLSLLMPDESYQHSLSEMKQHLDSRKKAVAMRLPGRSIQGKNILLEMTLGSFSRQGKSLFTAIIREIVHTGKAENSSTA